MSVVVVRASAEEECVDTWRCLSIARLTKEIDATLTRGGELRRRRESTNDARGM